MNFFYKFYRYMVKCFLLIHYTHDPVGNIVEIVDNAQQNHYFSNSVIEPRAMYKYDALYRLTEATGRELASLQLPTHSDFANNIPVPNMGNNAMQNYTQQFTYDELGNILQMKSVGQWTRDYNYDILHNNYLTGHAPRAVDYTYDEHGNMLSMPHLQSMHYDHLNQLNKVVLDASGNTAYYLYDANGQRARKVVEKGYVREERIYVGGYEVFRKYENSTLDLERSTVHIMDDKNRVALIEKLKVYEGETVSGSEQIRYQYSNHLGSASLELNATGQIISYEEYHPFGTTSYRSGRSETEVSLKRYKYVGKERDEETGLYYYGFRYYAAWIASFINVDPLQHEYPHYTPFQYAGNKPVTFIDLDGLEPVKSRYCEGGVVYEFHSEHSAEYQHYAKLMKDNYIKREGMFHVVDNERIKKEVTERGALGLDERTALAKQAQETIEKYNSQYFSPQRYGQAYLNWENEAKLAIQKQYQAEYNQFLETQEITIMDYVNVVIGGVGITLSVFGIFSGGFTKLGVVGAIATLDMLQADIKTISDKKNLKYDPKNIYTYGGQLSYDAFGSEIPYNIGVMFVNYKKGSDTLNKMMKLKRVGQEIKLDWGKISDMFDVGTQVKSDVEVIYETISK